MGCRDSGSGEEGSALAGNLRYRGGGGDGL
ncbi:unnamed protein product [Linum tenue]|uniref:Uncharacterized protein n=1 Tax=Linum tenue TaxID=586396 RepID=A0AAV0MTZ3_9ROSI|nr:unnamed protein product [Linum tenue]CAI0449845.1 unnamed protein product [Linum tenue]